jgi:hypothetical protein
LPSSNGIFLAISSLMILLGLGLLSYNKLFSRFSRKH